jgi:hypothetical protein
MEAHVWATWHHSIGPHATCRNLIGQLTCQSPVRHLCHIITFHVIVWPCHISSMDMPHQQYGHATSALYGLYSQQNFAVWQSRQNTISHSYDVCLNPFKLHWDHEDEAYARVCFEAIPSTLIFEHILIPWITPPHWEAFGPPKDYFQSI